MTPAPKALLFDMDGTLTEPMLDFPLIRREMGIAADEPILEALARLTPHQRNVAESILLRHEEAAAAGSVIAPGCRQLLQWAGQNSIPTALITRNSRLSATTVLQRHNIDLNVLICREDAPYKPDPAPLLLACRKLSVAPHDAWMIGDGRHDIEAGCAAGIATVWISLGRQRNFAAQPWQTVSDLGELFQLLAASRPKPEPSCELF
ncbi:MAG TPA: HAD family hydrolase [Tepidisphaeraceae bacterium]|nr:HAD family hydrolase [Tepidisphaeraceae bacterium]